MPEGNDSGESVSLGTKVGSDFKRRVRIVAAHKNMSMSEYVRTAVEQQLEEDLEEGNSTSPIQMTAD